MWIICALKLPLTVEPTDVTVTVPFDEMIGSCSPLPGDLPPMPRAEVPDV